MKPISVKSLIVGVSLSLSCTREIRAAETNAPFLKAPPPRPTLYLIGDSTVNTPTKGQLGWGKPIAALFDTNRINVLNKARGGRSSRTYYTEGLWEEVRSALKPGDFVLMQFGHNDGGPLSDGRARASIKGNGNETQEIENKSTG